jgi:hypothetical protein
MRKTLGLAAVLGLAALTGCSSANLNLGGSLGNARVGTSVDSKGNVGVHAGTSKTINTGAGTTTTVGVNTNGKNTGVDAHVTK